MRILLIEDSTAYREEFAVLLTDAKIKHTALDFAMTLTEGARLMALAAHDIYFVDYRLPGGDGLALVRTAREAGMTAPIIVLTGYDHPAVDAAAEAAGATDYLRKGGFSPQMLDRAIRYAMRNAEAVRSAKEASSLLRMAQDAGRIGAWDWDIRANTFTWSPRQREIFGLRPEDEVAYGIWLAALHPDDRDAAQAAVAAAVAGHAPFDALYRILRSDPSRPEAARTMRWIAAKGEVLRDAAGAPVRMVGVNVDVTEQQNAIAALRSSGNLAAAKLQASEARFQTYFESSGDCMFHVRAEPDGEFRYEAVNPAGLHHAGATLAMVHGRTPQEVLGPMVGGMMVEGLRRVRDTGLPYRYEPTFTMATGQIVYDALYVPLRDEKGEVTGVLGSARDITERRRLQASLHQAQKMEVLGQLAGGVAHDFNNLLTGMLGCFELLGREVTSEKGKKLVAHGVRAVERSTALTTRLLAFARQQPLTTKPADINHSLDEITEMLSRTLGASVRIGKDLAGDLWQASTDVNQIELALLNLGINARDAMPVGGTLTLSTRNETVAEPRDDLPAGDYVTITVADTGTGMTADVLARVREPFFTTKEPGKGTGLGLSMVAGVVKQLGGGLTIASEPGKGTCVTLFLPRAPPEAAGEVPAGEVRAGADRAATAARILLVEDDPDTRGAIAAYAAELGHRLVVANNAREALSLLDAGREIDVMIIDSTLPGMPCADLLAEGLRRRPGLPVMLLSGQTGGAETGGMPTLAKPFRQAAFNQAVAALIGDGKSAAAVIPLRRGGAGSVAR